MIRKEAKGVMGNQKSTQDPKQVKGKEKMVDSNK